MDVSVLITVQYGDGYLILRIYYGVLVKSAPITPERWAVERLTPDRYEFKRIAIGEISVGEISVGEIDVASSKSCKVSFISYEITRNSKMST